VSSDIRAAWYRLNSARPMALRFIVFQLRRRLTRSGCPCSMPGFAFAQVASSSS
jgi:hypothetical protein